ncbi:MAG: LPS-assembly protein LptD [Alphaproteobacteria bacterium]|nr:LPS-assembly protein LptD [Alphaproteobacteria bacterium]
MLKKTLLIGFSSLILLSTAKAKTNEEPSSLVHLDTKKTVEDTKPKSPAKLEPKYNITNILSAQPKTSEEEENIDIYFSADSLVNNSNNNTIEATGNVEIIRQDLTLKADKVTYNQSTDHITAIGNVVLLEKNGNVVFADELNLKDKITEAEVENIKVILLDKTRLAAKSFHKKADDTKVLRKAVYSPCDACRGQSPLWQMKALKVIHDPEGQNIEYQNAFLEIKGIPVMYTPYFSHPDPSVKHRSGLLFPRLLSNNYLGTSIQPQYFWDISEHENMILNPIISSDKGIVYSAIFNKYFYRGELNASGTVMKAEDDDFKDGIRGNLFLQGRYELNDYWVADTDINYVSDRRYLDDLSLPKKDDSWLTSRIRLQAFDNRNYAAIEGYYYDFLSYKLKNENRPYVLPFMSYENISSPNSFGGYVKTNINTASVYHDEGDASYRLSLINSWNLPYNSPIGEKYNLSASLKSDLYYISKYHYSNDQDYTGTTGRVFPQLGLDWRFPFIKNTEETSQILEPIIVAVAAPSDSNKEDKIPNEDSEYVNVTDVNIFDLDRYSGYDRNDTGSRVSYGLNWSFYNKTWGRSAVLLAQTYEFDKKDNIFNQPNEESNFSDYVGRIYAKPSDIFSLTYRFRLDKDDYDINYSELSSYIGNDALHGYVSYIFFPETEENTLINNYRRKELYTSVGTKLTRNWSVGVFARQDLERKEMISTGGNIIYEDECAKFTFSGEKDYYNNSKEDESGEFEFYFNFYLKTLGGTGEN